MFNYVSNLRRLCWWVFMKCFSMWKIYTGCLFKVCIWRSTWLREASWVVNDFVNEWELERLLFSHTQLTNQYIPLLYCTVFALWRPSSPWTKGQQFCISALKYEMWGRNASNIWSFVVRWNPGVMFHWWCSGKTDGDLAVFLWCQLFNDAWTLGDR